MRDDLTIENLIMAELGRTLNVQINNSNGEQERTVSKFEWKCGEGVRERGAGRHA